MSIIFYVLFLFMQRLFYIDCIIEIQLDLITPKDHNQTSNYYSPLEYIDGSFIYLPENDLLTIHFSLGTPKQSFNAILDTKSSRLTISSVSSNDQYPIPHKFNPALSSSFKSTKKQFEDADLVVGGFIVEDIISFYNKEVRFQWGLARETHTPYGCDGRFGMDHQYEPQIGIEKAMSIMDRLLIGNHIKHNIFSIKRDNDAPSNSKLFIGDYHNDFKAENNANIASCPLADTYHWVCTLSHIVIGNSSIESFENNSISFNDQVIFDTSTSLILLPNHLLLPFMKLMPSSCHSECKNGLCSFFCTTETILPDISFVFNGKSLKLNQKGLFKYEYLKKMMMGMILLSMNKKMLTPLIGMPFFYNFHVAFDNESQLIKIYVKDAKDIVDVSSKINYLLENPGIIVAIVLGCGLIVGLVIYGIVYYVRKNKEISTEVNDGDFVNSILEE